MNNESVNLLKQTFELWRKNPTLFVEQAIRATPSAQQRRFLAEIGKLVYAKHLSYWSQPVPPDLVPYLTKRGITIRSGHGTGKDASLAWVMIWFLLLFKDRENSGALIGATAPTSAQLKSVLWREIGKWVNRKDADGHNVFPFAPNFQILSDRIQLVESDGSPWAGSPHVIGRTASQSDNTEKQGETLAGLHANYFLVVADEASGVPDAVFAPLEGAMTQSVNVMILISNPTRTKGFFYDSHMNPAMSNQFIRFHWSAADSELVSTDSVEMMRQKYGDRSNQFRIRVLGEFPLVDENSLIPFDWASQAVNRDLTVTDAPVILGVDVARFGADKTAICVRQGARIVKIVEAQKIDTVEVAEFVLQLNQEYEPAWICIDTCGIGGAVFDFLRTHLPNKVKSVNVAESASRPDKFRRKREELFWKLRDRFEHGRISLPDDMDLVHEISSLGYKYRDGTEVLCVETKQELKDRGVASPNRLDALMLTMAINDDIYIRSAESKPGRYGRKQTIEAKVRSWMAL